MSHDPINPPTPPDDAAHSAPAPPPRDELDSLLRAWHTDNAERAAAGRDRLLEALRAGAGDSRVQDAGARDPNRGARSHRSLHSLRRFTMSRYAPLAAAAVVLAVVVPLILPQARIGGSGVGGGGVEGIASRASAPAAPFTLLAEAKADSNVVMAPEGGRLEAFDAKGLSLGPCALKHTDVNAEISGRFARVTVKQQYANPNPDKIEAVYTFPLSSRAAVDRMRMVIGDRVIDGEVRERDEARRMYLAARNAGRIASLLEQERPNIFTQSVANIEPGATIDIEISYVELLEPREGEFMFDFPTVVGPRYIPTALARLPQRCPPEHPKMEPAPPERERFGDELRGVMKDDAAPAAATSELVARRGLVLLAPAALLNAEPAPGVAARALSTVDLENAAPIEAIAAPGEPEATFTVAYADGSAEQGVVYGSRCGVVGGRWFALPDAGAPFASPTRAVPDADRITPMPVKPPMRAGHNISIRVTIDTGGPAVTGIESPLHRVVRTDLAKRADGGARRLAVALEQAAEIPNRDFVLKWRQSADTITESVLTHVGAQGGFFAVSLEPPARIGPDQVVARELIFVVDTSGSMNGVPIETCKKVIDRALDGMRPSDTFNLITFAGSTRILWGEPKANTPETRAEARGFLAGHNGAGGTEMMTAINAALARPEAMFKRPASHALRIVMFLTDAYVGNDFAIIDAIKKNRATSRVFPLGIGNSVNRFLIDAMAEAGGGEPEVVLVGPQTSESDLDKAVERFNARTLTPVLTDITYTINGLSAIDVLPSASNLPDLFDRRPLTILGRYNGSGAGSITVRGRTAQGPWERTIPLIFPEREAEHSVLPTLWARRKIDVLMGNDLTGIQNQTPDPEVRARIIQLGESFHVMSQFTSFVAVDRLRVTIEGKPRLVRIPIELPDQVSWEGNFGRKDQETNFGRREQIAVPQVDLSNAFATRLTPASVSAEAPKMSLDAGAGRAARGRDGGQAILVQGQIDDSVSVSKEGDSRLTTFGLGAASDVELEEGSVWRSGNSSSPPAQTLAAVEAAERNDLPGARQIAGSQQENARAYVPLQKLARALLSDAEDAELQKVLTEARAQATKDLAAQQRADRFQRVVARDLLELQAESGATLRVTILVSDTTEQALAAMKEAGLTIEAVTNDPKVVIGTIVPANLERLAAIETVRRIEKFEAAD